MEPVKLTAQAAVKVKEIMEKEGLANNSLRIGLKGGGCSGFSYTLDFTDTPTDSDFAYISEGVNVVVDEVSASHLEGVVVDYLETLHGAGFKFVNPNENVRHCGCGESFGYRE